MEDMRDHFRNDGEESMENPTKGKECHDAEDDKDGKEGEQAHNEELKEKEENHAGEAEDASTEGKGDTEKGEAAEVVDLTVQDTVSVEAETEHPPKTKEQQYSCSYTPPYYVPDFSATSGSEKRSGKSKGGAGLVALVLSLSLLVSVLGGGIGYSLMQQVDHLAAVVGESNDDVSGNGTDGTVTIIKNDGSIKVNEVVGSTGYSNLNVSEVVALVADSVVEITTSERVLNGSYVTSGAGSGVIFGTIDREGYVGSLVITNNHVIEGADGITVRLTNGKEYSATLIVEGDADYDIAVLAIQVTGLPQAKLGSSANLIVGEEVVAIGNPLGELGGTVTNGILSALDRKVLVGGRRMTLLQTNAAINPGNSGGGLFNMAGELIGIVNAKQSETGIEGLGFAIPIDVAYKAAKDMIDYGYVTGKLKLGFETEVHTETFTVTNGQNYRFTLPAGIYVSETTNAELKKYDRIVSMNGVQINDISDYYFAIDQLKEGDSLTVLVSRLSGSTFISSFVEVTVTLTVSFTKVP